jgi:hypothetical protein
MLHIELTKNLAKCIFCKNIVVFRFKPMPQWNVSEEGYLCGDCYEKKLAEYYLTPDRRNITRQADKSVL